MGVLYKNKMKKLKLNPSLMHPSLKSLGHSSGVQVFVALPLLARLFQSMGAH